MPRISQDDAEQRAREFIDRWNVAPLNRDRAIIALAIELLKVALETTQTARTTVQTVMGRETR